MRQIILTSAAMFGVCVLVAGSTAPPALGQPSQESFAKLHKLMAPDAQESAWMQVPWMPSSNIYAARKKAAEEGKPILLWYMAGETLGTC